MIPADAQPTIGNLDREVAVAEMPGQPQQMLRIAGADLGQRFRRTDNLDEPSIFEADRVARAQGHGFGQIQQEAKASHAFHGHATAMPVVIIKHHRIGGVSCPVALGDDGFGADHPVAPECLPSV